MLPRQLLAISTAADLEELREFEQIEPFGYMADEQRSAALLAHISNMMRGKDSIPFESIDFLGNHPAFEPIRRRRTTELTTPKQNAAEMKDILKSIAGK